MDIAKRNEIEAKLRSLFEKEEAKEETATEKQRGKCVASCSVIRRRKGEADKRIYIVK